MRSMHLQTRALEIITRVMVWLLLTGQFTVENLIIGLFISITLPPITKQPLPLKPLIRLIIKTPTILARAYREAFTFVLRGYRDRASEEEVRIPTELQKNQLLRFLWIVLFTLTPSTVVVDETAERILVQAQKIR
ncbi:MAG: Na+/H+ antiporter subunit E [Prochlorococcus sp.]